MATTLKIKQMPELEILNKDLVLNVDVDGEKLGEVHISKGSVDFYQKGAKKKYFRLSWAEFANLIAEHGTEGKDK